VYKKYRCSIGLIPAFGHFQCTFNITALHFTVHVNHTYIFLFEKLEVTTSKGSSDAAILRKRVTGVELDSLITEVKDILPHLGDGFVEVNPFLVF